MNISKKYKKYRRVGIELNKKIAEKMLEEFDLDGAVNLLGFDRQGQTIIFDSEFEMDVMSDFFRFESIKDGKRPIDVYKEEYPPTSEIEKEILESLVDSHSSLFKIERIDREKNIIWLSDILNEKQNILLVDIGLSTSAEVGLLMFTRLISFDDFCMTSGVSFVFNPNLASYLKRRYKKIMKKLKIESDSTKKFTAFFRLSKECGMEVINQ